MSFRILSCHVDAFGPFEGLHLDALDHPVVVIRGDNEAGKTTFFHFLQTMFYGIYPTDAAKHPYAPRGGQALDGSLTFRRGTSPPRRFTVSRRLRSTPQGRLTEQVPAEAVEAAEAAGEHDAPPPDAFTAGPSETLRNRTLPAVQHVPRSVYASVYALRLRDLVTLDGAAWDEVQDRLLGTLNAEHVRPARVVVEELEDEATDLWRPDNRGKPEAKRLEARRRALRAEAREARERDDALRALRDAIEQHTARLDALRDEQVQVKADLHRADRLVPVRTLLQRIDQLDAEAGDLSAYASVPDDPLALLDDLQEQIAQLDTRVDEKRATLRRLQRVIEAPTEEDARLCERSDAIRGWVRRVEVHQKRVADRADARRELEAATQRLRDAAGCLTEPWDDVLADAVRRLSIADLRERIHVYERAARRLRETEARAETLGLRAAARTPVAPWIVVAVVGAAVAAAGLVWPLPVAGVPVAGAVVALFGAVQGGMTWRRNRQIDLQREELDLPGVRGTVEERAAQVEVLLDALPLPEARLESPSTDLVTDLRTLKDALQTRDAQRRSVRDQSEALDAAERALRDLAGACGFDASGQTAPPDTAPTDTVPGPKAPGRDGSQTGRPMAETVAETVGVLESRLSAAEDRRRAADDAKRELPALRAEVEDLAERLTALRERHDAVASALLDLGDGDRASGAYALARRRAAKRRAETTRDRLHSEFPDWEARRDEIEALEDDAGAWTYTDEERVRLEQRRDAVADEITELEKARTAKTKDAEHLAAQRTVGDVESELAHVNRRLDAVRRRRDRLTLLAGIVRTADHDFRAKHQPDVVRRASAYLSSITDGRYERLALDELDDAHDERLVVYEAGAAYPRPVAAPLSQGTLDQVYLALRLAIVDHLDAERERLPVFLDEVFVNWDATRRRAAFAILAEMAQERQIFVFTCHPHFAREAERHLDAVTVDLDTVHSLDAGQSPDAEHSPDAMS